MTTLGQADFLFCRFLTRSSTTAGSAKVEVTLATHDAGGVTQKDIDLAVAMDGYAAMSGGK